MENRKTIKYFLYGRKSSESDEKQVQSIEDQILVMTGIAKSYGVTIVDVITESKSAKEPHARVGFEKMIERIKKGDAQGILCWKVDRLSRNPIDSATIQWLLQKEILTSIRTPDREYRPEDNVLLLSVESSMANQYIRDLSKNVKRGLKSKLDKGWMPCTAPLGYLNTKTEIRGENYIIKDPERFDLIRKAWDLMLTGNYNPSQIMNMLNGWGFKTRPWKKRGGKPLGKSTIYKVLNNTFYAGIMIYKGVSYQGKHSPMITLEEFDRVQILLGKEGKPRPQRHEYAYTGDQITCGECRGVISATYKEKLIKKTKQIKKYVLYYCTSTRNKCTCSQKGYTNVEKIEEVIERELMSITILPEFKDWALEILNEKKLDENTDNNKIQETQQKTLEDIKKQIKNLTELRIKEMIDDDEYMREKTRLKGEMTLIQAKIDNNNTGSQDWIELTEKTFNFACYAHSAFLSGDTQTKREILSTLSHLNCELKDNLLSIIKAEWFIEIEKQYPVIQALYESLELENNHILQGENRKKKAKASLFPLMRDLVDEVRTVFEKMNDTSIYIPCL